MKNKYLIHVIWVVMIAMGTVMVDYIFQGDIQLGSLYNGVYLGFVLRFSKYCSDFYRKESGDEIA